MIKKTKIKKGIKKLLKIFISYFIFFFILDMFFTINLTPSMQEGIYFKSKNRDLKKGDIVIIEIPKEVKNFMLKELNNDSKYLIKKIYGTKGDIYKIEKGNLYLNKKYIKPIYKNGLNLNVLNKEILIKENEYFLLGETKDSYDSAYFGVINKKDIKYKAKLVLNLEFLKKFLSKFYKMPYEKWEKTI